MPTADQEFCFRHPTPADGGAIWRLIGAAGTLDRNSSYLYLLLCRDFAATCLVAEPAAGGDLLGFVTGYSPPRKPDTLFIWQVGVVPAARGRGLARRMLARLLESEACARLRFLDTTVSPSNRASRALFESLARRFNTRIEQQTGFPASLFPEGDHEAEPLLHIGPMPARPAVTEEKP